MLSPRSLFSSGSLSSGTLSLGSQPLWSSPWIAFVLIAFVGAACSTRGTAEESNRKIRKHRFDLFEAPQGDAQRTLGFIRQLANRKPPQSGQRQQLAHRRKIARSIVAAARQALQRKPKGQPAAELHYSELQALNILHQMGEPDGDEQLQAALDEAWNSEDPDVADTGLAFYINLAFANWQTNTGAQKQASVEKIGAFIESADLQPQHANAVIAFADFLVDQGDYELAKKLVICCLPLFQKCESPEIHSQAEVLAGVKRRIDLVGKKITLAGTQLNGKPFDWSKYEGKVVLVDFWATSCGPCKAELPHVVRLYQAYREKGFEVVGVNLDVQPEYAKKFIAAQNIPWATLYSFDEKARGMDDPRAVEFGIVGLPYVMLIDREGRVVSMNARGDRLSAALREFLGEPLAKIDPPAGNQLPPGSNSDSQTRVDRQVQPASDVRQ